MVQVYIHVHVKFPLFVSRFSENWIFSGDFWKYSNIKFYEKSIHWECSCSMRTDGQTNRRRSDITKL